MPTLNITCTGKVLSSADGELVLYGKREGVVTGYDYTGMTVEVYGSLYVEDNTQIFADTSPTVDPGDGHLTFTADVSTSAAQEADLFKLTNPILWLGVWVPAWVRWQAWGLFPFYFGASPS